ncbi:MAG: YfhO family protein, partial [Bacteroidota bacterium]
ILADTDPHYRVYNTTVGDPFQDATTSYHHKSIGGYHAAKLQRYEDIKERYLTQGNQRVFDMLNTKYIIGNGSNGPQAQRNPGALGNAWLVSSIRSVSSNNEELAAVGEIDPANTAVVHSDFADLVAGFSPSGSGSIQLTEYSPNELKYSYNGDGEQLVVFSEVWYGPNKGWKAYIDGQETPVLRANYVLRAIRAPTGQHNIELKFDPPVFKKGVAISWVSSLIILLGLIGYFVYSYRNRPPAPVVPAPTPAPVAPTKVAASPKATKSTNSASRTKRKKKKKK